MKFEKKTEKKILLEIGERLIKLREKKGYKSYEAFAIDNELSRMHYWRMEKGLTNVTIRSLTKVLDIHKVSLEDFFKNNF